MKIMLNYSGGKKSVRKKRDIYDSQKYSDSKANLRFHALRYCPVIILQWMEKRKSSFSYYEEMQVTEITS